jgi:leader peptidase (prepilin peptidase)/N-methyltransferase
MIPMIKGAIFLSILLYASNCDVKTREVPDFVHIMILITGLIEIKLDYLPSMIAGFLIVPLPFLISAILRENSIGGADIKLVAACSFLLGFQRGIVTVIVGLILAVLITTISRNIKKHSFQDNFPIVPYLALGSIFAYFI